MERRVSLIEKITTLLGPDAVLERRSGDEPPRVAPAAPDAVGLLLSTANAEGWKVRVEGAGTWMPGDAPADLILTTRRLDKIPVLGMGKIDYRRLRAMIATQTRAMV